MRLKAVGVVCVCVVSCFSCVQLFATLWTPTRLLYPWGSPSKNTRVGPPGDLPDPGIEPVSFISPALAGGFFTTSTTWEAH